jgi:peptidoglycan/LPS O-acetylase OafA/YrhL
LAGNEIWQEKAYLPGMSAIAFGVLSAVGVHGWTPSPRLTRLLALFGVTAIGAVYVWGDLIQQSLREGSLLLLCAGAVGLLLAASASRRMIDHGLGWLATMGRLSYEIYLSHMFVVLTFTSAYRAALGNNQQWTFAVYVPALAVCVVLGKWLHATISEPARLWLQVRLIALLETRPSLKPGDT